MSSAKLQTDESSDQRQSRDEALLAILNRSDYNEIMWGNLTGRPSHDEEIQGMLTKLFGPVGVADSSKGIVFLRGGKNPAVWFGNYDTDSPPALEGQALIDRVREVLKIPRDIEDEEADESPFSDNEESLALSEQMNLFDYAQLSEDDAIIVRTCTAEIRERIGGIKLYTLEIGDRLREVKARLERGTFDDWLAKEIGISRDTADRLIKYAGFFSEESPQRAEIASRFERSAVYLLVEAATPESAREEAVSLAESGEKITRTRTREIVERHKREERGPGAPVETPQESAENITETITESTALSEDANKISTPGQSATVADLEEPDDEKTGVVEDEWNPSQWLQSEFTDQTITVTVQIFPGTGSDRRTLVSAGVVGQPPVAQSLPLWRLGLNLSPLSETLNGLRAELPARLEVKKQAEAKAKPASAARIPAKKAAAGKPSSKKASPKKPATKKSTQEGANK